jgi:hypothetical protein
VKIQVLIPALAQGGPAGMVHAFATRQSRVTVTGEMPSTWAVSSTLSPPKKRISTTCTFLATLR